MARSAVPLDTRSTPPAAPGEAGHGSLHARVMRRLQGAAGRKISRRLESYPRRGPDARERRPRVDAVSTARRARRRPRSMRLDPPGNAPRRSDSSTGIVGITRVGATSRARGRGVRSTSATDGATRPQRRKIRAICLSLPAQFTALLRSERLSDPRHRARGAQIAVSSVSRGALPPPKRKAQDAAERAGPLLF